MGASGPPFVAGMARSYSRLAKKECHRMRPFPPALSMARPRLAKSLSFRRFPPPEEELFLRFHADKTYPKARFGVVFGLAAWVSFCVWDALAFPRSLPELAAIRLGLVAPLIGGLAWFIIRQPKRFKARMQIWLSLAPLAVALGLFLMITLAWEEESKRAFQQLWPAFSGLCFFLYAFLGLRLLPAAALGLASFALAWIAGARQGVDTPLLGAALLQLAILNLLGMIVCGRMEIQERTFFRLRQHHRRLLRNAQRERLNAQDARDETLLENARAEAALMLARDEREKLAAAIAEKERFLSAAYHDLQQPLSTIGLYVRLAKAKPRPEGELSVIENAAQDIALMFKGVRDAWEVGGARPALEAVNLAAILDEIERELRERAGRKGLDLRMRKPSPRAAWVRSDRTLLKRALSNLVGNALKYTERGGVLVRAVGFGNRVRVDVCDTGIGIAAEFQQRIFEEYFRVANLACERKRGLGLGLAIVRRIERNLPGHCLRLASQPGRGSRFSLSLPTDAEPRPAATGPAEEADRLLEGKYIVVVEDEQANLAGLVRALGEAGCIAEGADSAATARRLFGERDRCPDVLVSDFLLGQGQTGLDAVAALRERFEWAAEVPVVFVTGDWDLPSKLAGFQGVYAIHHKPIDADALLASLRGLLKPPPP